MLQKSRALILSVTVLFTVAGFGLSADAHFTLDAPCGWCEDVEYQGKDFHKVTQDLGWGGWQMWTYLHDEKRVGYCGSDYMTLYHMDCGNIE